MNLIHFSDSGLASRLIERIRDAAAGLGEINIMEVCGTHTMEIGRLSLRRLLPANLRLISGPGCPVCVTPGNVIDAAARLSLASNVAVLTFGDMIRVPGNVTSLEESQSAGGHVEVVTSPLQAVRIAGEEPDREFVFVAVGFETTIPVVARAVTLAAEKQLANLSFLVTHRLVPPALRALGSDPELRLSGLLLPGHVSAIIGVEPYVAVCGNSIPAAVTGFEALDIIGGVEAVVSMLAAGSFEVVNRYPRVVRCEGNPSARALIETVFEPVDAVWRGIGSIPESGLRLREQYRSLDAGARYGLDLHDDTMPVGCSCGDVLRGKVVPNECPLFGTSCTPESPVGPCMVSSEGSCAAYYRYGE